MSGTDVRLSVVVPTCGRPQRLAELLERLRPERQGLPPDRYEVIVSDDGTGGGQPGVDVPFALRFVAGPGRGPAANRNHGARHAAGDWLVFTDDDCRPRDGWLRAVADRADAGDVDVIEGMIVAVDRRDTLFHRDVENLTGDCFWSANLAMRRSVFAALGGFDEDFGEAGGEDMELAHRIRRTGLRTTFCSAAIVDHPSHVVGWRGLLAHTFRIRWHVLFLIKTGQARPLDAPLRRVLPRVAAARSVDLVRVTWRTLAGRGAPGPLATRFARVALSWALFPIVLPYILYWDARFRARLRHRAASTPRVASRVPTS